MQLLNQISRWQKPLRGSGLNLIDELLGELDYRSDSLDKMNISPACDVSETDNHYYLSFDLPGIKKKDLKLSIKNNELELVGTRDRKVFHKSESSLRHERHHGRFRRLIKIPESVEHKNIQAEFEDGVLNLTLPKVADAKGRNISIGSPQKEPMQQATKLKPRRNKTRAAS